MTTYTAISATETQSGKPITESLMTRFANNCLAIQEGDPTAPRIKKEAFDAGELTVIDSAYSTGTSVSFTFNHGEATSQTVYIVATASGYLGNGETASLSISVAGSAVATAGVEGVVGTSSAAVGRAVSVATGDQTISASGFGGTGNRHTYLQAMVLKR